MSKQDNTMSTNDVDMPDEETLARDRSFILRRSRKHKHGFVILVFRSLWFVFAGKKTT